MKRQLLSYLTKRLHLEQYVSRMQTCDHELARRVDKIKLLIKPSDWKK